MRLLKADEMRKLDRETIDSIGIPAAVLMENAARSAVSVIDSYVEGISCAIICGKGNNGGDGLAVARNLYNLGYDVEVIVAADPSGMSGETRGNFEALSKLPVPIHVINDEERLVEVYAILKGRDFVVDAIFGTGLSKPVSGFYERLIDIVNREAEFIVSLDIPSGLPSDSGKVIGKHIVADITVTFGYPKVSLVMPPACESAGEVFVADISIPDDIAFLNSMKRYILSIDHVSFLFPERHTMDHKYTFGHLAVVGGSKGKTGAACMAAMSALRAGCGLSTVFVPESLNEIFEVKLTEVMSFPVDDHRKGYFGIETEEALIENLNSRRISAVAVGPGMGVNDEVKDVVHSIIRNVEKPLILDADALNCVAQDPEILKVAKRWVVITPHIGEFSRLTGKGKDEIENSLCDSALEFATEFNVTVVLKSGRTVIASPDGNVFVNVMGNPGMATAGTGDVLTGVIGGLAAMGLDAEDAAKLGVFIHSLSGDMASEEKGQEGLTAVDLIEKLPQAIKLLRERESSPELTELTFVKSLKEILGV